LIHLLGVTFHIFCQTCSSSGEQFDFLNDPLAAEAGYFASVTLQPVFVIRDSATGGFSRQEPSHR
jgi:hypothetical protein